MNVGRDCGQERAKGRSSWGTVLVTENALQSQLLSRPFLWPAARGTGWPCRSVATEGLLGQWAGTLNNSAGTTGRVVPLTLPGQGGQWPQGDCQDSYVPLEGTPNQVEKAKSTWLSPCPSVCGRLCWRGGQPEASGGLLEEGAEALTLGDPAALRSVFCTKSCCFL